MIRLMELVRVAYRKDGVFGVLLDCGSAVVQEDVRECEPFAVTCEEVWEFNAPRISCIPAGTYTCKRVNSPKFGNTFEVTAVPGRSSILFHAGNTIADTEGCIMVAEQYERFSGAAGVAVSRKGFDEFKSRVASVDAFMLVVRDASGGGAT